MPRGGYGSGKRKIGPAKKPRNWVAPVDQQQNRAIARLKRETKKEIMTLENNNLALNTTLAPTIQILTAINQGDDEFTRTGNEVTHKSYYERMRLENNVVGGNYVRVIYFIWKMSASRDPPVSNDILQVNTVSGTYAKDDSARAKYIIKSDKTYWLGSNTGNQAPHFLFPEVRIKLNNKATYLGPTNAIADADRGHLFRLIVATSVSPTYAPSYSYQFTD